MGRLPICLLSSWGHLGNQSFALGVCAGCFQGKYFQHEFEGSCPRSFQWIISVKLLFGVIFREFVLGIYCRKLGTSFLGSIYGDLFEGDFFWRLGLWSVEELFSRNFCWGMIFGQVFLLANYFPGILLLGINFRGEVFLRILFCGIFFGNYIGEFPLRKAIESVCRMGTREWSRDLSSCIF